VLESLDLLPIAVAAGDAHPERETGDAPATA